MSELCSNLKRHLYLLIEVERNGAASGSSLAAGVRILEVNDESLLGCSQDEAARVLRRSGENVRLLVCDAFTTCTPTTPSNVSLFLKRSSF
ncbi:unnamed protein product [Anisakis simplex]|uniref:PDZ domain-containing protein n=1 Tax=Anisakis simplex TaxID=6269 RepID=A0A0M3KG96_ANISI|nr:unnamed protein product [Anisakis simplex]